MEISYGESVFSAREESESVGEHKTLEPVFPFRERKSTTLHYTSDLVLPMLTSSTHSKPSCNHCVEKVATDSGHLLGLRSRGHHLQFFNVIHQLPCHTKSDLE